MASFVGKTGQTTATLHTVSYLVSERSNYRSATKKKNIRIRVAHNKSREKFNTLVWL